MAGCSYCGIPGHEISECPDRLEQYYGTSADQEREDNDKEDNHE